MRKPENTLDAFLRKDRVASRIMAALVALFVVVALALPLQALAEQTAELVYESDYVVKWCGERGGVVEKRLDDGSRVDCYIERDGLRDLAVEADFSSGWAEAVGQSLFYGKSTGAKPVVLFIQKRATTYEAYKRHHERLRVALIGLDDIRVICLNSKGEESACPYFIYVMPSAK